MFVFLERRDDLHSAMLKVKRFPSESEDLTQPTASGVGSLPYHGRCDGASLSDQRGPAEGDLFLIWEASQSLESVKFRGQTAVGCSVHDPRRYQITSPERRLTG